MRASAKAASERVSGETIINTETLAQLVPGARPYEMRDARAKGFLVRLQPSGVATYYVEYARGKRLRIGRVGELAPDKARQRAKDIIAAARLGQDPAAARREARKEKALTLEAFLDEHYESWAAAHLKTKTETVERMRFAFAALLAKPMPQLAELTIERWRKTRLEGGTHPATTNRDLDDLRAALEKAVKWGLIASNPVRGVKRLKTDRLRAPRYLTEPEEARLRAALDAREERIRAERDNANAWRATRRYRKRPDLRAIAFADHLKPLVLLSLHTGMRQGELFALTWESVDLERRRITVAGATAKSGTTRHISLNTEALEVLRAWRAQAPARNVLVFPGRGGRPLDNVDKAWKAVLAAAAVTRFRWHDLRHTFASNLVMAGVDLNTVRVLMGHSDYKMTQRYAHLAPEHEAAAVEKLVRSQRGTPGAIGASA